MNVSKFFIDRPVFAGVLSIVVLVTGAIGMQLLPISEYPDVAPPNVVITAVYPGANPKVIADTVATPIEEQINGVEDMLYMQSQSTADGVMNLTVTFKLGTDPDKAQQLVQNRVAQAEPRLPAEVRSLGITTVKSSPSLMMGIQLESADQRYDPTYLRNYAVINIKDRLSNIEGVGRVLVIGAGDYAMRVWIDPEKASERNIAAGDIVSAIQAQNVQAAAGIIGAQPSRTDLDLQYLVNAQGRLKTPEEFANIIVKSGANGEITRLRDVARVEMGAADYSVRSYLDNLPGVALIIFQQPNSNAIEIATNVRKAMADIQQTMPQGMRYNIVHDTTEFVTASIEKVIDTLLEAVLLVVIVVIIFLQTWRASIIPLIAVPVSIIGTFGVMYAFGFSINALSLFGMVLAIGIVVDDAIVVVENVERNIASGLTAREATYKAMREVSGPIIAIALVLVAVFVPMAFISGLSGQFYRQFALTIAISTVISAFNSLTLSPALAAVLLRGHNDKKDAVTRVIDFFLGWFFVRFNRVFSSASHGYSRGVGSMLSRKTVIMAVYLALVAATYWLFQAVPTGFIPTQDKQFVVAIAQLPSGASLDRTEKVIKRMGEIAQETPGVIHSIQLGGVSIDGFTNSTSAIVMFIRLESFESRHAPEKSAGAIRNQLNKRYSEIKDAFVFVVPPPPVEGLGSTGGFKLQIEDRAGLGYDALEQAKNAFIAKARGAPELAGVYTNFQINVPQLFVDLNRTKAEQLGVSVPEVFQALQIYLGSVYVNDFNQFGRTFTVRVQADQKFRQNPEDIARLKVRSASGEMIPLAALLKVDSAAGPEKVTRYNGFLASDVNGSPAPGYSTGQAQAAIERIAKETLPPGIAFEWTDLTYQQILAGNSGVIIFPLALLLVYLVLAAQYESMTLPLAIVMIVPMGVLAAMTGVWLTGSESNIFTQIGLMVLVGLSAKNAILIVEFARELEFEGYKPVAAAIEASKLRLRPILMTSLAFIMGVLPLVVSTGAGAEMRVAMGVAVFWGMLGVTFFGIFMTPVFYVLVRAMTSNRPLTNHTHGHAVDNGIRIAAE